MSIYAGLTAVSARPPLPDSEAAWLAQAIEVRTYIRGRVPACDADDVLQDSLFRLLKSADRIADEANVRAFAIGVARNVIREHRRAMARRPLALVNVGDVEGRSGPIAPSPFNAQDDGRVLQRAVADLPAKLREAIDLHYFAALSTADTADRAGCTPRSIRRRLALAHRKLRRSLRDRWPTV